MNYTWRIILTSFLFLFNSISLFNQLDEVSSLVIVFFILNLVFGWLIGYQFDKYRYSKKELASTKDVIFDYSFALDSAADAIGITNEKGQFEFVNDALTNMYGYSKGELLTKAWHDCYSRETIVELYETAVKALSKDGQWRGETIGLRKNGTAFPQEISLSTIFGTGRIICVVRDITKQKQAEENMRKVAEHNDLTNLPNRRRLLTDLIESKQVLENITIFFIDLDHFKFVNDTFGHDCGDDLLRLVAKRITSFNNESINVYHHSGDEFIVLIQNCEEDYIHTVAKEMIESINEPFYIEGNEVNLTTSIGISRYPDQTDDINELIKMADTAMYYAKMDGKNTFKPFNNDLKLQMERRALMETELSKAIVKKELLVHYQPKVNMVDFKLEGIEALIRWENERLGRVSPMDFIPIAEDTGLIVEIGNWVFEAVFKQMASWQKAGHPLVKTSINVSQRQFREGNFVPFIKSCLELYKIDSKYVEIEITESVMEDYDRVIPKLMELKDMGISLSIDDFGTGYSSLSLLKNLPIDTLKIDQSFVRDLLGDSSNNVLVKTIVEIGDILNLHVIAEGVETREHLDLLIGYNCSVGQGYYFSKPLPAAEFEAKFINKGEILLN